MQCHAFPNVLKQWRKQRRRRLQKHNEKTRMASVKAVISKCVRKLQKGGLRNKNKIIYTRDIH